MTESEFSEIVADTKAAVLAAVSRTLDSNIKHLMDDVVQDTYLRAYRALKKHYKQGKSIDSLHNYLYTIAKNESNRMNVKEANQIKKIKAYNENKITQEDGETDGMLADIKSVITTLPKKYAEVLSLFIDGYSLKEIGSRLSMKEGTVKSSIFRGKKILVNHYKGGDL